MFVVALLLFAAAAVAVATGLLGLTGRLPRNRFVGVHSSAALTDENTFRLANRVAAPTSVAAGFLLFAGGLVALAAGGLVALVVAAVVGVVAVFTLGAGANAAERVVAPMVPEQVGGCGSACGACSLRSACEPA
ncbi:SdpI family protein [Nocardia harenae]|uniref:SdpI family protein n=1 Tax=Nocardia harenae TaxID=358707 RepID=UPI000833F424|nr:SdpI family protein [Nocardia harenae]